MGLSFLDVVGSFTQGVQERGAEIDKEIADRIKELNSNKEVNNFLLVKLIKLFFLSRKFNNKDSIFIFSVRS